MYLEKLNIYLSKSNNDIFHICFARILLCKSLDESLVNANFVFQLTILCILQLTEILKIFDFSKKASYRHKKFSKFWKFT